MVIVIVAVETGGTNDLVGDVVAVLLGVEDAPAVLERTLNLGSENAAVVRVAVRHVNAGNLVVAVVDEARAAEERGVDRRRRIAALGDDPDRLVGRVGVVLPGVVQPRRIESIA